MSNLLEDIKSKVLVYDGSKGTMLHRYGMKGGECPELWNVTHAEDVKKVYNSYKEAGADVIQSNTFQGSRIKLEEYSLDSRTYELNYESIRLAKEVMGNEGFVAGSIGPIGKLFEPSGDLTFECAYETFKEQVKAIADAGADAINFETFTDLAEMRAALLAAKDVTNLPVICSIAFESNGRTLMGTDPKVAAVVLESLGADMVGTNCSLGPQHLVEIIKSMNDVCGLPLCAKPNAGLPELVNGEAVFKESPENFSRLAAEFVKYGVRLIGGCCGTTPEFIKALKDAIEGLEVPQLKNFDQQSFITSSVKLLDVKETENLKVGQISTADESLSKELSGGNIDIIVDKAIDLASEGFDTIYVNVDAVGKDDNLLASVVNTAQGYLKEPMIIETVNVEALDKALKLYKGKAGVIINGLSTDINNKLTLVAKKYGSTIIDKNLIVHV